MTWVELGTNVNGSSVFGRVDDDGAMRLTATADHPELVEWLAEGNTPEVVDFFAVDPAVVAAQEASATLEAERLANIDKVPTLEAAVDELIVAVLAP